MNITKFKITDYLDSKEIIAEYLKIVMEEGSNSDILIAKEHIDKAIIKFEQN